MPEDRGFVSKYSGLSVHSSAEELRMIPLYTGDFLLATQGTDNFPSMLRARLQHFVTIHSPSSHKYADTSKK